MTFADSARVNDSVIVLRDVAASVDAPQEIRETILAAVVGEAAPAGHARFLKTDEVCAERLRPAFPGVDWQCNRCSRIRVRTEGVVRAVGEYEKKIRDYVASHVSWVPGDYVLGIDNSAQAWNTLNRPVAVEIGGLKDKFPVGALSLELQCVQGTRVVRIPVRCRMDVATTVVVAREQIDKGQILGSQVCGIERRAILNRSVRPLTSMAQLTDTRARRTISAGTAITEQYIERIPAVSKGDAVSLSLHFGRVSVSAPGVARESGSVGERIWVENAQNRKLLRATVVGRGAVRLQNQGGTL